VALAGQWLELVVVVSGGVLPQWEFVCAVCVGSVFVGWEFVVCVGVSSWESIVWEWRLCVV
jgi:hypothetical protein